MSACMQAYPSPPTHFRRLACAKDNPAKRAWEVFNLKYAVFWVGCFAAIIGFDLYEHFDEVVCSCTAVLLLLSAFMVLVRLLSSFTLP